MGKTNVLGPDRLARITVSNSSLEGGEGIIKQNHTNIRDMIDFAIAVRADWMSADQRNAFRVLHWEIGEKFNQILITEIDLQVLDTLTTLL
jgi:hypothetical protein